MPHGCSRAWIRYSDRYAVEFVRQTLPGATNATLNTAQGTVADGGGLFVTQPDRDQQQGVTGGGIEPLNGGQHIAELRLPALGRLSVKGRGVVSVGVLDHPA